MTMYVKTYDPRKGWACEPASRFLETQHDDKGQLKHTEGHTYRILAKHEHLFGVCLG